MSDDVTELVEQHLHLARSRAKRHCQAGLESYEDVYADALVGLWDAARKFEPERGWQFATYATHRIDGAIGDGRRERDPLSRSQRKSGEIENPISLDELLYDDEQAAITIGDQIADPHDEIAVIDTEAAEWTFHLQLRQMIAELPFKERHVVTRYLEGAYLWQIAEELEVTESRCSQLWTKAMSHLRQLARELDLEMAS